MSSRGSHSWSGEWTAHPHTLHSFHPSHPHSLTSFTPHLSHSHPELSYVMRCAELCENFHEDLEFHFSLSPITIMVSQELSESLLSSLSVSPLFSLSSSIFHSFPQNKLNVGSPSLGNVQGHWSTLRTIVPVDLALPVAAGVGLLAVTIVSEEPSLPLHFLSPSSLPPLPILSLLSPFSLSLSLSL